MLLGATPGPALFAHIAEYGDGWMPIGGAGVGAALPELRRAMEKAGRDPAGLQVVVFGTVPAPAKLERFASIGVTEVALRIPEGPRDAVLPVLDEYAKLL
jgi:alkanesulfonate monooxygenase SsuD/methylene tetrahydromethanopterin reductase-like flavin-dependent oxidoreductase (luciferase family)